MIHITDRFPCPPGHNRYLDHEEKSHDAFPSTEYKIESKSRMGRDLLGILSEASTRANRLKGRDAKLRT